MVRNTLIPPVSAGLRDILLSALPPTPQSHEPPSVYLDAVWPQLLPVLSDLGTFPDDRAVIASLHGQVEDPSAIVPISDGGSGTRVWVAGRSEKQHVFKLVSDEDYAAFIREAVALLVVAAMPLGAMRTARLIGLARCTVGATGTLILIQTWCPGRGLGSYVRAVMSNPTKRKRTVALQKACRVFTAVGQAFADFHSQRTGLGNLQGQSRLAKLLERDFAIALRRLQGAAAHAALTLRECEEYLRRLLESVEARPLPLGPMHLDPHFGNVRIAEGDGGVEVGLIDMGTAYYAFSSSGPALGLPEFDCRLLTSTYLQLRALRGPRIGQGALLPDECAQLASAYWVGYGKTSSFQLPYDANEFYDAVQCCWYLTWFAYERYCVDRSVRRSFAVHSKEIAVAFYIERFRQLVKGS